MPILSASQVREEFAECLNRVAFGGERVILQRHGKPVAALISMSDLNRLEVLEGEQASEFVSGATTENK
jgi:prevent-host-death family protein